MKVSIIMDNGTFRIHGAGCRDVAREATAYRDEPWTFEASDRHEVNVSCWGDIASDTEVVGTDGWDELCDEYARTDSLYLPCCPKE